MAFNFLRNFRRNIRLMYLILIRLIILIYLFVVKTSVRKNRPFSFLLCNFFKIMKRILSKKLSYDKSQTHNSCINYCDISCWASDKISTEGIHVSPGLLKIILAALQCKYSKDLEPSLLLEPP